MYIQQIDIEDMLYGIVTIHEKLHHYVYGNKGFDDINKAEKAAVIALLNDANNFKNSLSRYLNQFDETDI